MPLVALEFITRFELGSLSESRLPIRKLLRFPRRLDAKWLSMHSHLKKKPVSLRLRQNWNHNAGYHWVTSSMLRRKRSWSLTNDKTLGRPPGSISENYSPGSSFRGAKGVVLMNIMTYYQNWMATLRHSWPSDQRRRNAERHQPISSLLHRTWKKVISSCTVTISLRRKKDKGRHMSSSPWQLAQRYDLGAVSRVFLSLCMTDPVPLYQSQHPGWISPFAQAASSPLQIATPRHLSFSKELHPHLRCLQLCILQYRHGHPISSYFRQNRTVYGANPTRMCLAKTLWLSPILNLAPLVCAQSHRDTILTKFENNHCDRFELSRHLFMDHLTILLSTTWRTLFELSCKYIDIYPHFP